MKRAALVVVMLVGCGDDGGGSQVDSNFNPGPDYDLSCLNVMPTAVPAVITEKGVLYDFTMSMIMPIPMGTISAKLPADNSEVGTGMTDMDGKYMFDVTGTGAATRYNFDITATGFVNTHSILNIPLYPSTMDKFLPAVKQSRIDALATAFGTTANPAKGALEVWVNDCGNGEFPMGTIQLDGATTQWAMFGGMGVWVPRDTLLQHLQNLAVGSIAGMANVDPGMHSVTVTSPSGVLMMTGTIDVKAGEWNLLVIYPGKPNG